MDNNTIFFLRHAETQVDNALERFSKKIEEIDNMYDDKKILIASHGCVINLYFAKLVGKLKHVFEINSFL